MSAEKVCIFCQSEITEGDVCPWCGFSTAPKAQLDGTLGYGTHLENYILADVIDMDGESTSYSAYDTQTQQKVIVKEFLPVSMVSARDGNAVTVQPSKEVLFKNLMMDFTDLYSTLVKIESKAMQKVNRVFSANNTVYVVLDFVKGDSLRQTLIKRGKPYSFKEARWLFQELFRLMDLLEKANISHGGISDETVMVTPDNTIVLTGFAIPDLRVKNEHIMYKLYEGFSAPEQYSLNQFSGFYTDIYSVSALLYHIVTGRIFSPQSLELKDLTRYMPKYAVDALKYATKPNPQDRIDNITDFVLMLDNKATITKPEPKKQNKQTESTTLNNKYLTYIIIGLIFILFMIAMLSINPSESGSSSQIESQPESVVITQLTIPDLSDKTYNQIMNDDQLTKDFYFNISEDFSSLPVGQVISQQPAAGTTVSPGTIIYITVSKGQERVQVQIPYNLVGRPESEARALLDTMGIKYYTKAVPQTRKYPSGTVAGLSYPEGMMIYPDETELFVYVSDDTPVVEIPTE